MKRKADNRRNIKVTPTTYRLLRKAQIVKGEKFDSILRRVLEKTGMKK